MTDRATTYHPQMLTDMEWYRDHDQRTGRRAVALIEDTVAHPENGLGLPKKLRDLANVWSRRVTAHHRLYYLLTSECLRFISCRDHDIPQHIYEAIRERGDA